MITSVMIASILCSAPQATSKGPASTAAEHDAHMPAAVQLEVDVSRFDDEPQVREWHVGWVREDATKALEAEGVAVVSEPDAPKVIVAITWANVDEMKYGVTVSTQRPGVEPKVLETFPCLCNGTDMTAEVAARMPAALAQLGEDVPREIEPEPAPEGSEPVAAVATEGDPTTNRDSDGANGKPTAIGPLGYVGIAVAAGGLGIVGWGAATLAKGEVMEDTDREQLARLVDHRPPGRALLGTGIGAAVVGVTMLVLDVTVMKKRRERATTIAPQASPTSMGLTLTGRF